MADCKDNDNDDINFCQPEVSFVCLVLYVFGMVNWATNAPPQICASLLKIKIKHKFSLGSFRPVDKGSEVVQGRLVRSYVHRHV